MKMIPANFAKTIAILLLLILSLSLVIFGQTKKENSTFSQVKLLVISQRWLTPEEKDISLNIAIRVRLSNESRRDVFFRTFEDGNIHPLGYHYIRKIGTTEWKRLSPYNTFAGSGYRTLILSPGMKLEFDIASMSLENVEQKFSVVLGKEKESELFEVFSDIFQPITK